MVGRKHKNGAHVAMGADNAAATMRKRVVGKTRSWCYLPPFRLNHIYVFVRDVCNFRRGSLLAMRI